MPFRLVNGSVMFFDMNLPLKILRIQCKDDVGWRWWFERVKVIGACLRCIVKGMRSLLVPVSNDSHVDWTVLHESKYELERNFKIYIISMMVEIK